MNVREKLNALKDITEAQQQYGTRRLYDLGILYDDGTIEGVNDNIPKMVARIDDDITSLEYAWSSQKITDNLSTNLAGYYTKSEVDTALGQKADTSSLGTAAAKDVPTSGDASSSQVVMGDDSRLSDARTPTAHNQASNTITAMTGYSKPSSTSAITVNDTLNEAIGKLEKGLESSGGGGGNVTFKLIYDGTLGSPAMANSYYTYLEGYQKSNAMPKSESDFDFIFLISDCSSAGWQLNTYCDISGMLKVTKSSGREQSTQYGIRHLADKYTFTRMFTVISGSWSSNLSAAFVATYTTEGNTEDGDRTYYFYVDTNNFPRPCKVYGVKIGGT